MSEVKKRLELNLLELYQLNWFLGAGLALLALWPVFYLDFAVLPYAWVSAALIAIAIVRPALTTLLPKKGWQVIPFLLVLILAVDLRVTSDLVPSLVRLNILLILYRCLSYRRKREDLQLVVLCLFLMIIAGVRTVAMSFVAQILAFTALAMAFLFNIVLIDDSRAPVASGEIWKHFAWGHFLRKLRARCDGGFLVIAGMTFSSMIGLSILLFLVIPRFSFDTRLPFLGIQGSAQTGFSESIRFGDVTNLQKNDRVALRVEVVTDGQIPVDPYFRMLVLDEYVNGGFQMSQALQQSMRKKEDASRVRYSGGLIASDSPPEEENLWTFYLEGGVARYLPLTGRFELLRLQELRDLSFLEPAHVLGMAEVNSNLLVYQVEDMEFSGIFKDENFGHYTLEHHWHPEVRHFFHLGSSSYPATTLALPPREEDVAYLRGLVREIGQGEALTAEEFARRATAYLQERHTYSMSYSLSAGKRDHVVRWLMAESPGHCEAFAGALILICRAAGIPARAVTGFRGGTWNAFEHYFMVRNSDAHAWVEIFDGKDSWIRFDPTPGGESAGEPVVTVAQTGRTIADSSLSAYLDSLRILWYRRIVSFDQESQVELWALVRETISEFSIREWIRGVAEFFVYWWQAPWNLRRLGEIAGVLTALVGFALLILFCVRRDRRHRLRGGPQEIDGVRRLAGRRLQRMRALSPSRVDPEAFGAMLYQLEQLRYGPAERREGWREILRRARRIIRAESRRRRKESRLAGSGS